MAILTSRSSRRREWLAQTRLRSRFERRLAARMRGEFRRTANDAARGYSSGGEMGAMLAVNGHRERVAAILGRSYRGIMLAVNERLSGELRALGLVEEVKLNPDASEFLRRVDAWIALIGGQKIKRITDTTFSQIVNELRDAVAEGEGQGAVAKRIRDLGVGIGPVRAETIARTEIHAASMQAQRDTIDAQPESVREQMRQEWVAAEDERTRPSHRAANGQIVGYDESFEVGGVSLRFPGDPAGPPREVVNCRCVNAPLIDDEFGGTDILPAPKVPEGEPHVVQRPMRPQKVPRKTTSDINDDLRRLGGETGHEHMIVVDGRGREVIRSTSGNSTAVTIDSDSAAILNRRGGKFVIHHNHPGDTSLSLEDFAATHNYRGVSRIYAHGSGGSIYSGSVIDAGRFQKIDVAKLDGALASTFRPLAQSRAITKDDAEAVFSHLRARALSRAGVVKYNAKLSPAMQKLEARVFADKEFSKLYDEFVRAL